MAEVPGMPESRTSERGGLWVATPRGMVLLKARRIGKDRGTGEGEHRGPVGVFEVAVFRRRGLEFEHFGTTRRREISAVVREYLLEGRSDPAEHDDVGSRLLEKLIRCRMVVTYSFSLYEYLLEWPAERASSPTQLPDPFTD